MPELRPITQKEAFAYIEEFHRHHNVPVGALWWQAAHDDDGRICGVAITGRPVAQNLDDGLCCEVTRLCTNGTDNACSILYAASRRAAITKGYRRGITYILDSEYQRTDLTTGKRIGGKSLEAAGWRYLGKTKGGSWDRPSRGRSDKHPTEPKHRYGWGPWPEFERAAPDAPARSLSKTEG
jgi:hypothetical protein